MTSYLIATHVFRNTLQLSTVLGTYIDVVENIRRVGWRITERLPALTSSALSERVAPPAPPPDASSPYAGHRSGSSSTTRTPSSGPAGGRRSGRAPPAPLPRRIGSVAGSGSLLIFVRVKKFARRTFTATWVTRRSSATTDSVSSRSQALHVAGDLGGVDHVGGERLLATASASHVRFVDDRGVVATQAEHAQVRADRRAEAAGSRDVVGAGQVLDRDDAERPGGELRSAARSPRSQ
jgi:hypothetical protein